MKKVSIVGYGRFGKVLYRLLKGDFFVTIYDKHVKVDASKLGRDTSVARSIDEVYQSEAIFFAVPIENFEQVISEHKKHFRAGHLLIDVLSVKMYPAKLFQKHLKGLATQALLTHPMFGPDSSSVGFEGLPMIMDRFKADWKNYGFWKGFFAGKKLKVIELTAQEHDRLAANSQGLAHFIGRLMEAYGLGPTPIDSLGAKKLLEIKDQTCNDTWQLFTNLQHYNPYTAKMRLRLGEEYDRLYNTLLPKQISHGELVFGIQGGKGSFNEEALGYYIEREGVKKYKVKYLYTSDAVLRALHEGGIDRGQFAIHNSAGGIVDESVYAMAKYKFRITDKFAIRIAHALMIRKDADISKVKRIMTHPQVLAQCQDSLRKKYPRLLQTSGKGKLIDHALVARALGKNKLPKDLATMGSRLLAEIYDLRIVEDNLQDLKQNYTVFLQVARN
jgi:prephenate dehydrogenase